MIRERDATIGHHRTRVFEAGAGRPVVLLHAFPLSAEMWTPQLDTPPGGWRVIAPDFRGFGPPTHADESIADREAGQRPAPTINDFAGDVRAVLDALEVDRAVIVGLSMGGYVAFALLRQAPERFDGIVLADTRPQADTAEGREARTSMIDLVRSQGPSAVAEQMLPRLLGATTLRERPAIVARVRQLIGSNAPSGLAGGLEAMRARPDSTADLGRIAFPALVVVGEEDAVTPPAEAEAMHRRIPGSRLVVIPQAGHLSNIEAPDVFSKALGDFLLSAPFG